MDNVRSRAVSRDDSHVFKTIRMAQHVRWPRSVPKKIFSDTVQWHLTVTLFHCFRDKNFLHTNSRITAYSGTEHQFIFAGFILSQQVYSHSYVHLTFVVNNDNNNHNYDKIIMHRWSRRICIHIIISISQGVLDNENNYEERIQSGAVNTKNVGQQNQL